MKTKEELNELKEEVETLNKKLADLTEEELEQVAGGKRYGILTKCPYCGGNLENHPWYTEPGVYRCISCRRTVREVEPVWLLHRNERGKDSF